MAYLLASLGAANLITFALVMPRFSAPDGWPPQMRWLSLSGIVFGCASIASVLAWPAGGLRGIAAAALALSSQLLFRWAISVALRHQFAVAFSAARPTELVAEGPYRWMAHPLYASYAATWWALAAGSTHWVPTLGALVMSGFYVSAAVGENRVLKRIRPPSIPLAKIIGGLDEP